MVENRGCAGAKFQLLCFFTRYVFSLFTNSMKVGLP